MRELIEDVINNFISLEKTSKEGSDISYRIRLENKVVHIRIFNQYSVNDLGREFSISKLTGDNFSDCYDRFWIHIPYDEELEFQEWLRLLTM